MTQLFIKTALWRNLTSQEKMFCNSIQTPTPSVQNSTTPTKNSLLTALFHIEGKNSDDAWNCWFGVDLKSTTIIQLYLKIQRG